VNAVDALAVEAVLASPSECSDADRARAALEEALAAARAPRHGVRPRAGSRPTTLGRWSVTMVAGPDATRGRRALAVEAVIQDDAGDVVARRTLSDGAGRACVPLARAVGAWASLVLDAELARAKDDDAVLGQVPTAPAEPSSRVTPAAWPAAPRDAADAVQAEAPTGPRRSMELGSMVYLRNGMTATGGVAGLSPYLTIELAPGWVLRPAASVGRSTSAVPVSATATALLSHVGTRVDFCRRIPGNYIDRRGIEADLCAGVETGFVTSDETTSGDARAKKLSGTAGRLALGPAMMLRGQLGAGVSLEVRTVLGTNLLTAPVVEESDAPLVTASAELGVSVRLP